MSIIGRNGAWDRYNELESHEKYGADFNALANQIYIYSARLESDSIINAEKPVDGEQLAQQIIGDLEPELARLPNVSNEFQEAVHEALPVIREKIEHEIENRVKDGEFTADGDHTRKYLGRLAMDVMAAKLEL